MRAESIAVFVVGMFALTGAAAGAQSAIAAGRAEPPLVIEHVTVVDVERGRLLPDRRVVVTGTRITAVDSGARARPGGARVVDGRGKYLLPGLWDMHVHTLLPGRPERFFPLLVANGITGVRDMGGSIPLPAILTLRREIAEGQRIGPRLGAVPGRIIDGPGSTLDIAVIAATPEDGRRLVRAAKEQGADFIKVYNLLPRDTYLAVADEARRQEMPLAGHIPFAVTLTEAVDAGQKSIEHTASAATVPVELFLSASSEEPALRRALHDALLRRAGDARMAVEEQAAATYDTARAAALFARLARAGTWQCPTIVLGRAAQAASVDALLEDDRLRYVTQAERDRWRTLYGQRMAMSGDLARRRAAFRRRLDMMVAMQRAGVPVLAGTDAPNPFVFPGFSLHEELALLVEGGLGPLDALRAATLNPARYLGATDSLGSVAAGKLADLVLLDADPLADIHNTTRIRAVVANGRFLDREALDGLLADAERLAGPPADRGPRSGPRERLPRRER